MVARSLASMLKAMNPDLNEKVVIVSGGASGIYVDGGYVHLDRAID
jgi:hypothetical protein